MLVRDDIIADIGDHSTLIKTFGKSLLAHMDDLGFLKPEVTCGHCVLITEGDIELLADRGCGVTNHVSCNLRVRNGICPAHALLRRGVPVAIGIDDKGLADSRDFIEEMRLVAKLNRNPSHRLDSDHLTTADVFTMGTANGGRALGWEGSLGRIAPGMQADPVLIDLERICAPYTWTGHRSIISMGKVNRGMHCLGAHVNCPPICQTNDANCYC